MSLHFSDHATPLRRITVSALRRSLHLTGHCELCGAGTLTVAFMPEGAPQSVVEICSACSGEANRRVGDDAR